MLYSVLDVGYHPQTITESCVSRYIYKGKDAFLWLPTSFGKSTQVLLFVFDMKLGPVGSLVVVSPLPSLTIDKFVA